MSEVIGSIMLTAVSVAVFAAFGAVVITSFLDSDTAPLGAFSVESYAGAGYANVTFLSGTGFAFDDAQLALLVNESNFLASYHLVGGASADRFGPGDVLRANLSVDAPPLGPGTRLTFLAVDRDSGRAIGMATATIPGTGTESVFIGTGPSLSLFTVSPSTVTADGATLVNLSVTVSHPLGLGLVRGVSANLTSIGGAASVALADDGAGADAAAGDGVWSAQFVAPERTFSSHAGSDTESVPVTATDALGRTGSLTGAVTLAAPAASKVVTGATYRDLPESGDAAYIVLSNFTFRDPTVLGSDEVELRIADLLDGTRAWTALVTFDYAGCGNVPSVTSITLTRDGVTGSAVFTPSGGCFSVGPNARLDISDPSASRDNSSASAAWSVTGSEATFGHAAAGLSGTNEATVTFFGDGVAASRTAFGLGHAELEWASLVSGGSSTVPGQPSSLSATGGDSQVSLSWTAPASDGGSAVTGYRVYRGTTSGSLTLLQTVGTNTSYVAAGLTNGVTYHFAVSAVNANGESSRSSEASATPQAAPSAPQSVSATAGDGQASLSWSAPASDGGSPITAYRVYRGTTSGALTLIDSIGTNTSYVAAGLTNGVTYYFQISAVNANGEGDRSAEVSASPTSASTVPGTPQSFSATGGDRQASLTWTAPASDGGSAVTSYRVYRGTTSGSLSLLATIGTNTSYVAAGLTNGVTYYFQVSAVNAVGEGARSSEASATPATTPGAPQNLAATAGNAQVSLTWSAPASNGGSAVTGYTVYYGTTNPPTTNFTFTTSTSATVTGLTNAQLYYFAVSASNSVGEGAKSAAVSATPESDTSVEVNCSTMTVTQGTISDCTAIQFADLTYATFTESTGSIKLFEAQFTLNVTGLTGAHRMEINGYRGNAPEDLHIQAWNATSASWNTVATLLSTATSATTFSGNVYSTHHFASGILTIRLIDPNTLSGGADNGRSSWNIDYVRLVTS